MRPANPTPLQVGATGTLDGRRWRVAGRVVVGADLDGTTYYWNEYNLVDGFGRSATLVFEEGDAGPEWKLFTFFEPLRALTAAEAAAQRVGEPVNLDGHAVPVTLVGQSQVYHIEGKAPDGVEVGDVAHYFNADTGSRMLVVSWTGDDVEFFAGRDLHHAEVATAFNLDRSAAAFTARPPPAAGGGVPAVTRLVGIALALVTVFSVFTCGRTRPAAPAATQRVNAPAPPAKRALPAFRLANGARGTLAQGAYTVTDHAVIAVGRVGARFDRHEYRLVDDSNEAVLLINGLTGGPQEWHLFRPLTDAPAVTALTPHAAAALRKGAPLSFHDRTLPITELFQARTLSADGGQAAAPFWPPVQYGFLVRAAGEAVLARWTEEGIRFYRGKTLPAGDVLAALGPGPEKAR